MKVKWTKEWPKTDERLYWFYGWTDGKKIWGCKPVQPELTQVKVQKISNGYVYSAQGEFIWEKTAIGLFAEIDMPEIPDISELPESPAIQKKSVYAI